MIRRPKPRLIVGLTLKAQPDHVCPECGNTTEPTKSFWYCASCSMHWPKPGTVRKDKRPVYGQIVAYQIDDNAGKIVKTFGDKESAMVYYKEARMLGAEYNLIAVYRGGRTQIVRGPRKGGRNRW